MGVVGALSAFFNDSLDIRSAQNRELACTRMVFASFLGECGGVMFHDVLSVGGQNANHCSYGVQDPHGTPNSLSTQRSLLLGKFFAYDVCITN